MAAGYRNVVATHVCGIVVDDLGSCRDQGSIAGLETFDHRIDFGPERAARCQFIVEACPEDPTLRQIELGCVLFEGLKLADQGTDRMRIARSDELFCPLAQRVALRDEVGPESRLSGIVLISRGWIESVRKLGKARYASLVGHTSQIC